ncbi:YccF domain-containing protein [Mangrovactinospora gilvigrisea]|uniref:YccF domain-containing protein n=1 Tax=Mangrovactinospora gilvigrisea TaxID=1428644 RepID=UPI001587A6E9|nr:YccF domain-containing protein [Mangrovactinospora gilvigrisea]
MDFILNVLWLVLCGFWMALGYVVGGLIACITIIGIPFGVAAFRIAGFVLWPFGRTAVRRPDAGAPSTVGNVVWFVFAGLWLAIGHIVTSIPLFCSIIGIPFGWANLKLIPISIMPLGAEVVPTDQKFAAWR